MRLLPVLLVVLSFWGTPLQAKPLIYPIAPELRSEHFRVTVGHNQLPVAYAATSYYFFSFAVTGKTRLSITADTDGYWDKGVEVQPWRWGIRPEVRGRTITFTIPGPVKLCISRPGDHGAGAEMLFLFADGPEINPPKPGQAGIRFYAPGTYRENIDAKNGETIYLAPGAVVFGALNIWQVSNVKVMGRGTIVYEGAQNPDHDEGWMHKPNWHGIVMDHARNIQISGITCIVRSRTWMIQMLGSRNVTFDNVKVIGGCKGNANQDGMDWLGGGDTVVRNSFFRASDDVFAMQGNWLGYDARALATPGDTINNILVEDSVLSTSISNIVRTSWPTKISDTDHFRMKDSDVIHMGMGGCVIPFGLLEIWNDASGKGLHTDYSFENIRLEEWYSLLQLRYPPAGIRNVTLKNIWALENPSLVPSVLSGDVSGVTIQNLKVAGQLARANADVPVIAESGASPPAYTAGDGPRAAFHFAPVAVRIGKRIKFDASNSTGQVKKYEWLFGDGGRAHGRVVHHKFRDSAGTLRDGSGRFRVLLKTTDSVGRVDWASQPVVAADSFAPPAPADTSQPAGWRYRYFEGTNLRVDDLSRMMPTNAGIAHDLNPSPATRPRDYAFIFDGFFDVPVDGGYTFFLLANDDAVLEIDSKVIAVSPQAEAQVCGMTGNMVQLTTSSTGLKAGKHSLHVAMTHSAGPDGFAIKWQGPSVPLADIEVAKPTQTNQKIP